MNPTEKSAQRRRFAPDPRLLIGLVLVAASVTGVVTIVSTADSSVQIYAALQPLSPGDRLEASDLVARSVRMDDDGALYLQAGAFPAGGLVVTRSVNAGELVPVSALGSGSGLRLTALVLDSTSTLPASVQPGSLVEVWAAKEIENGQYGPPAVILSGVTVSRLVATESIVGSGSTTGVELLVPKASLARVLEAIANSYAISIVPSSLPSRG